MAVSSLVAPSAAWALRLPPLPLTHVEDVVESVVEPTSLDLSLDADESGAALGVGAAATIVSADAAVAVSGGGAAAGAQATVGSLASVEADAAVSPEGVSVAAEVDAAGQPLRVGVVADSGGVAAMVGAAGRELQVVAGEGGIGVGVDTGDGLLTLGLGAEPSPEGGASTRAATGRAGVPGGLPAMAGSGIEAAAGSDPGRRGDVGRAVAADLGAHAEGADAPTTGSAATPVRDTSGLDLVATWARVESAASTAWASALASLARLGGAVLPAALLLVGVVALRRHYGAPLVGRRARGAGKQLRASSPAG